MQEYIAMDTDMDLTSADLYAELMADDKENTTPFSFTKIHRRGSTGRIDGCIIMIHRIHIWGNYKQLQFKTRSIVFNGFTFFYLIFLLLSR